MNYSDNIYCTKCDAEIDADDRFCGECGAIVEDSLALTNSNDDGISNDKSESLFCRLRWWKWILFPIMLLISYVVTLEAIDPGFVLALAINSDAKLLASGGDNGSVMIWQLPEKSLLLEIKGAHPVRKLAFNKNGDRLAIAYSESMDIYFLSGNNKAEKIMTGNDDYINALCFDGESVYTINNEGRLRVWNVEKNWPGVSTADILEKAATQSSFNNSLRLASFSQNCRRLVTDNYSDKNIIIYKVDEFKRRGQKILHVSGRLESMASIPAAKPEAFSFINDGAYLAELNDYELLVYDVSDRKLVEKIELSHMPGDAPLVIDLDRKNIITGWGNGSIGFDDMKTGKSLGKLYHGSFLYRLL